jgi:uncharacterized integral membrane protein
VQVAGESHWSSAFALSASSGLRRDKFVIRHSPFVIRHSSVRHPFHLTGRGAPAKQSATPGHTASSPCLPVTLASSLIAMGFKVFLRIVVFLAMLFVLLYVGMNNTQPIAFSFPMAFAKGIAEPAALIYFGIFAIGVIAGAMLNFGGGKKSSPKSEKK